MSATSSEQATVAGWISAQALVAVAFVVWLVQPSRFPSLQDSGGWLFGTVLVGIFLMAGIEITQTVRETARRRIVRLVLDQRILEQRSAVRPRPQASRAPVLVSTELVRLDKQPRQITLRTRDSLVGRAFESRVGRAFDAYC
jgi:hypothetical protein